ncbi:MAG: hypothetical protein ACW963_04905 [Candidatus Sifarchaeia archaeon]|jgi:hypothetical protein
MTPIGLIKCKACGGKSYFSEAGENYCACYVGFAGMGDSDNELHVDSLPDGAVIIYLEMVDKFDCKNCKWGCLDVKYLKTRDNKHAFFSTICRNCGKHDNVMRLSAEDNEERVVIILAEQ